MTVLPSNDRRETSRYSNEVGKHRSSAGGVEPHLDHDQDEKARE